MRALRDRDRRPELMDRPDAEPTELTTSLADLRFANRWLGGTWTLLRRLAPLVDGVEDRRVRVLDVATGSADLPVAISDLLRRRGRDAEITAIDLHLGTVEVARRRTSARPDIAVAAADARALPFPDRAFHLAVCSTALHHFDDTDAAGVLREMARVASTGIVVLDLRRSVAGLAAVALLAGTLWRRHPITRHDGPASVRGSFTPRELRGLAEAAGLRGAAVRREPLFRQSLVHVSEPG